MEFTAAQILQILYAFNYDYGYRTSLVAYLNALIADPNYGQPWFNEVCDLLSKLEVADEEVTTKTTMEGIESIRVDGEYTAQYTQGSVALGAKVSRREILTRLELLIGIQRNAQPKLVRG